MIAVSRGNNAVSYGVNNIHNAVNCDVHNIYNAGCGMSSDMCNKDILHISLPAQLTVMAAMVLMVVISLITTCIKSSLQSGYYTVVKQSCRLSEESVFASYNNQLLKDFNIFALNKSDILNNKLCSYINENISSYSPNISLSDCAFNTFSYMTDNEGYGVEEQIVKAMEYGMYSNVLDKEQQSILSGEEQENVQNDKEQESVQADNECKYVRCGENLSEAQAYSEQFMEDNENLKKDLADMLEQSDDGDMQYEDRQKEQINTSLNAVWQLYEYLKSGICETVTEGRISNKYIEIQELADEYIKSRDISFINKDVIKRSIEASGNEDTLKKNVLSTEYVAKHFICYTDTSPGDNDRAGSSALLDYEMEYIIGGEHNDRKNVYKVINQLAVIREGVNLSYLISSQDKMSEAYMLAAALVGVTGCDLAVRLVQYIIVSIWAYAESIVELRKLLAGETIALIKNRDNWILQLSSLVDEKLNLQSLINNITSYEAVNNNKVEENGRDNCIGYKEYLKLLIMFMNKSDRNYRIAALMELRMIMYGHSGFRMKNYIYAAFGAAHFKMNGTGSVYRQKLSYSYI